MTPCGHESQEVLGIRYCINGAALNFTQARRGRNRK